MMGLQRITFEELQDSIIGEYYDFSYLHIKQFNRMNIEFNCKGKLMVDTITTNVISIIINVHKERVCQVTIYKDTDFILDIMY